MVPAEEGSEVCEGRQQYIVPAVREWGHGPCHTFPHM